MPGPERRPFIVAAVAATALLGTVGAAVALRGGGAAAPAGAVTGTTSPVAGAGQGTGTVPSTAPGIPGPSTTAARRTSFGDGTWPTTEVAAGTYEAPGGPACRWARLGRLPGGATGVVASDQPAGQSIVTILQTDVSFLSGGCGTWQPLPGSGLGRFIFGDGNWAVGSDILPGTYRAAGGPGCSWERERDFLGEPTSIIDSGTSTTALTVTIAPTDKGFEARGCGYWSQAGT